MGTRLGYVSCILCCVSNLVPTTYVASSNRLLPLTNKDALDLTAFPFWEILLKYARNEYRSDSKIADESLFTGVLGQNFIRKQMRHDVI